MPINPVFRHSFQGIVVLLLSACLLLVSTDHSFFQLENGPLKGILVRSQLPDHTVPTYDFPTSLPRSVTQQSSRQYFNRNDPSTVVKRDPASEEDFQRAKEHGDVAYDEIQAAFSGCESKAQEFPPKTLNNGWTRKRDQNDPLEQVWADAFQDLLKPEGDKIPTKERVFNIRVNQDKPFTNKQGEHVNEFSPSARYYQYYVPVISAIVISEINSPFNQVRRRYEFAGKPVPSSQYITDHLVPPLNRWSDVTWTIWKEKAGDTANNLRYLAHDAVENEATDEIAAYIFAKARNSQDVPYPGLDFGMDSREGRALLGTPNGIGTARILIDRAKELGKRELRVKIFTSDTNGLCMLWDMVPSKSQPRGFGVPQLNRREFYAKFPSPLVKRATQEDFLHYKRQGDTAYDDIQRTYARNLSHACVQTVEDFPPEALANGWVRSDEDGVLPPDQVWETIFANLPGHSIALTAQQSSFVTVAWEKPFTTRQGLQNRNFDGGALYSQFYIPSISAIIAANNHSPAQRVKDRFRRRQQPIPSSEEISNRYVPPLNRWSDVTWTIWRQKAGSNATANRLRYIARDVITNEDTRALMRFIFQRYRGTDVVPFPGLEFGMDTDEGRALLGTPNGIGTARLLIDRAAQLGRRNPRVRIFTSRYDFSCMLWDMVPVEQGQEQGRWQRQQRSLLSGGGGEDGGGGGAGGAGDGRRREKGGEEGGGGEGEAKHRRAVREGRHRHGHGGHRL